MGLSRLDNFLKSVSGAVLYVDPNSLDSTDSVENQGNSLTRPFKTIQRALIEAARFSYQRGLDNDRFNKTTIILYPGEHVVDNRPGYIPDGSNNYRLRSGATTDDLSPWSLTTNYDLSTENNTLYKLNSIHGGVIIPRGVSIVGMDLRKTKVRPRYVPNPENDNIERSAIFRVTGGCYLWQFTLLDADPNGFCYKDYTSNRFVPNFSHHKLSGFEYADGTNGVDIDDTFVTYSTSRTDLDMYYEKVGIVYGQSSGRPISPDYPSSSIDIEPVIDEYRIVGSTGAQVGISSIKSGDGVTPSATITVTTSSTLPGLGVDTPIRIEGVDVAGYDGQYVISGFNSSTEFTYTVQNAPLIALPTSSQIASATLNISVDSVTSASPYIFNISLRSVYGMCGLLADGDKASGFKSMVVAQFTGIGLQKDTNAFVRYDETSGTYKDNTVYQNLNTDSRAKFKPTYSNFHIKAVNNSFLQLVSIFAIGYAEHFVCESGGDMSITNSNSNFGAKSLVSRGFRSDTFERDDSGYITHIIPPKEIISTESSVEFVSIDVGVTTSNSVGAATTDKLFLYNETNEGIPPQSVISGYRLGAKTNDRLFVELTPSSGIKSEYYSRIVMPGTDVSSIKEYKVGNNSGINSITSNILTLEENHSLTSGETIRILSENGHLPDGLDSNQIYYVIADDVDLTLNPDEIKIAQTFNESINNNSLIINNKGGILSVQSRISDKAPGQLGHPIQWDSTQENWYVWVSTSENTIYDAINGSGGGTANFGLATPRTYLKRKTDERGLLDTVYRLRYVIPKEAVSSRPPLDGFIIQESGDSIGTGTTEISKYFDPTKSSSLSTPTELRNPSFIANANWSSNTASVTTEIPHNLNIGDQVKIVSVASTNNPTAIASSAFNGTFTVSGIGSAKEFSYTLSNDPGVFSNDTSLRTSSLPYFQRKRYNGTYQVYRSQEIKQYIPGSQDGIYHLILTDSSNTPTVAPFNEQRFSQPIQNLYPQTNRDNPVSNPKQSETFALPDTIGLTVVNDPQNSITKECLLDLQYDSNIGFGLTDIVSNSVGTSHTFYTERDHGLSGITSVSIVSGGLGYGSGSSGNAYNAKLVGFGGSTTGENATAVVSFDGSGTITAVRIMDGGSAYGIGNTLGITGIGTTTGYTQAVVQVTHIDPFVNKTLQLEDVTPNTNDSYNRLYYITGIQTGNSKQIEVASCGSVDNSSTTGLGLTNTSRSLVLNSGYTLGISTINYTPSTGLATIGFTTSHGLRIDNKINLSGATESFFNGDFIINKINSLTSIVANIGIGTTTTSPGGDVKVSRYSINSQAGDLSTNYLEENIQGRLLYSFAGVSTTLNAQYLSVTDETTTPLSIINADLLNINLGDYLLIDDEIFRVKTDITNDSVYVFRALHGTERQTHDKNSVVRKIRILPIEFRRNSIIRASGHTFEYLGFGPGNYSTALPDRQDRILSPAEELISQNTKIDGGISIFTAMNSDGDFYTGNKKVNSATGQEEVFDAPVPTVTGEELGNKEVSVGFDLLSPLEVSITRSLNVEGGPDRNLISQFDGPVVFNNKIVSNSEIETDSLFLQGEENVSRKISISEDKPTIAGNYGDINFNSNPISGEFVGWTYVRENRWEEFGFIGENGVGISSRGDYVGIATAINIVSIGFTQTVDYDSVSGIATLTLDTRPRVAITTGSIAQNLAGLVTTINFVGALVTVTGSPVGIATVYVEPVSIGGSLPGAPFNSLQYNDNGRFEGANNTYYDPDNNQTHFGTFSLVDTSNFLTMTNNGRIGIASTNPSSKLEIVADNEVSLYIKSTSGTDIVRVDNTATDTTPFIIDQNGSVGINVSTVISGSVLDVVGNTAITGEIRIYNSGRTRYVGLKVGSLSSNRTFTLPTSYGSNGQVLYTNGSGVLDWQTVSRETTTAGNGISISKSTDGSGNVTATISNSGVRQLVAGSNITLSGSTGNVTISAVVPDVNIYPFTTKGFSLPI